MTFKKAEMEAGPPQPKTVGFRDLVGTGIAPVSKKTAVKANIVYIEVGGQKRTKFFLRRH